MPYYDMDRWVADGGNPQEFYFGAELPAAAAPTPDVVQAGFTTGQYDNLKAMGFDDPTILANLNSYLSKTGNTKADVSNWGGEAVKRVMGMQANPYLEKQQQNKIASDTKRMQTNTTDWGYLPLAASIALGGTLTPWMAGAMGGGTMAGLGANALTSGLTSGVFVGDIGGAMGRSLLTGGLNAATGGIGNVLKSGGDAVPDWMNRANTYAENEARGMGTKVAALGNAGMGGGMFEDIPWGMTSIADAGGSSPLTYSYPGWDMSADMGDPNSIPWGMTSAADAGGISNLGGSVSGWNTPMSVDWGNPSNWGQALGIGGAAAKYLFGGGSGSGGGIGSLLGMGLGGLLGGMSANPKPAGTVTSITDIPDWQKQYAQYTQQLASGMLGQQSQDPRLTQAGTNEMIKTVGGGYLNSNPYLDATYKKAADQVGASIDSRFAGASRYGSGAHQGVLGTSLGNLATDIYGGNYQAERGRQNQATLGVPSYQTASTSAMFAPLNQYKGLTTGYNGQSTTNPYFSNTAGGMLSGALAGSQLGRMW